MSFPIGSMQPDSDAVTGSIRLPAGRLADEEDQRRSDAALSTALDPQGDSHPVHWENPTTHHKGSFTALGNAYPTDARVCRAFTGTIDGEPGGTVSLKGTACMVSAGVWAVTDATKGKKS